ncbi:MAG: DUF1343 domain-containing protein [Flavobacteriales bacterium]|nr:DUF1343 domain-containing protein [Flavobacteriales bacterium]
MERTKIAAFILGLGLSHFGGAQTGPIPVDQAKSPIVVGAQRTAEYFPLLQGKRIAIVTNHTGLIGTTHLVDSLVRAQLLVRRVFAPEHGFRGDADAGELVQDGRDTRTGVELISLYGDQKKPKAVHLADIDVVLFDIQDVGVRFYTYISTLHYVMQACAELKRPLIVLDRPDPNGFMVDGPVLDTAYRSFVGMHPVPLLHGMTIGEYARMIEGEGWLGKDLHCELTVVPCIGYTHRIMYVPPVKPSPNLSGHSAILLYPALGLFEGTLVSVGRGTDRPFTCIGYPGCPVGQYSFTPRALPGAKDPPYKGQLCNGLDLAEYGTFYTRLEPRLHLQWLIGMYQQAPDKHAFFNPFFDKLAGGPDLRERIVRGENEEQIRTSWQPALNAFRKVRQKYLLYEDL